MNKNLFPDDYGADGSPAGRGPSPGDEVTRPIRPKSARQAIQPELAPPPPQPSRRAKHPLVIVLNFFVMGMVILSLAVGGGLYFGKTKFEAEGPLDENRTVMIPRGSNLDSIAGILKRASIISSDFLFTTAVRIYKEEGALKAGEYLFEPQVSMRSVMDTLTSGKAILHSITIPEGLTSIQIIERLKADPLLVGDVAEIPDEGKLLPETYKFTRGATRQQILNQMKRARDRVVTNIWSRRSPDLPIANLEELVTLASIVEKETGRADERPRVAAVFINRLNKSMRLQSDPTIIYGIFGGEGKPKDRAIFRSDIETSTPYNTYVIDGLPPGPIANPGRAAMEAVANPSRTSDLYFVADGAGGHAFAESLDDHNRNVARWRRIEAAREEAAKASETGAEPDGADPQSTPQ